MSRLIFFEKQSEKHSEFLNIYHILNLCTGDAALLEAAKKGNLARVQKLAAQENINCRDTQGRNSTPLHLAGLCILTYLGDNCQKEMNDRKIVIWEAKHQHTWQTNNSVRPSLLAFIIWKVGGRVVRPLLQLSETWSCHILFVGRMKFASLEANLGGAF